jgi:hypothetical protein
MVGESVFTNAKNLELATAVSDEVLELGNAMDAARRDAFKAGQGKEAQAAAAHAVAVRAGKAAKTTVPVERRDYFDIGEAGAVESYTEGVWSEVRGYDGFRVWEPLHKVPEYEALYSAWFIANEGWDGEPQNEKHAIYTSAAKRAEVRKQVEAYDDLMRDFLEGGR